MTDYKSGRQRGDTSNLASRLRQVIALPVLLCAGFSGGHVIADTRPVTTVALTGTSVPMPGGSQPIANFLPTYSPGPSIAPNGQVLFLANAGPSLGGIWTGSSPGNLSYVAAYGAQVPGMPAGTTFGLGSANPVMNATGKIAESGPISGPNVTGAGQSIFLGSPTLDTQFLQIGDQSPLPEYRYGGPPTPNDMYIPALNNSGQLAFATGLENSSGTIINGAFAEWTTAGGQVIPIAQTGAQVPGMPAGTTFGGLNPPGLSQSRTVVFDGTTTMGTMRATGIFEWSGGTVQTLALSGQQAPSAAPGVTFSLVQFRQIPGAALQGPINVHVNSAGEAPFFAQLSGPGVTSQNNQGVYVAGSGLAAPLLVARDGDQAPGLANGTVFTNFVNSGVDDTGRVAVLAGYNAPGGGEGIWLGQPGNLHLLVHDGQSIADGTGSPLVVSNLQTQIVTNALGEIVFQLHDSSIIASNVLGQLVVIARPGDSFQVAPGDFRTVASLTVLAVCNDNFFPNIFGYNYSGGATPINDLGQIVFEAQFTDGSYGVFTSNAVAVPEPSAIVLAALGVLALLAYRRKVLS